MTDDNIPLEERRYVLQLRDGDFVKSVRNTGMETVTAHFSFTSKASEAKVFSFNDLFSRLATNPTGILFTCGFAGGKLVRLAKGATGWKLCQ